LLLIYLYVVEYNLYFTKTQFRKYINAIAEWYGAGLRGRGGSNPDLGCGVPTPTQRAIPPRSVNEYQRKLGSKRAYHAIHWPRIRGLAASAGVQLRANETEISAAPWAYGSGKDFTYFLPSVFLHYS